MKTRYCLAFSSLILLSIGGCASDSSNQHQAMGTASATEQAALIGQMKSLEGTWMGMDETGAPSSKHVFAVTSNGTAVREIMFPGEPYEMTNMYHMDGPSLIMTHYCAEGNQPRMRAMVGTPGELNFKPDSVSNLPAADIEYMGAMKIVIEDKDHIRQEWHSVMGGSLNASHDAVFRLTRAK